MSAESAIWLHSLGVVVVAKYHNPSIPNKDFLARRRIAPEGWEVTEAVTTPAVSVIKYSNGVQWMVDQDRLTVTEACNQPLQQNEDSEVHGRASLYVETLPHTPYTALVLNYTAPIIRKDPGSLITQHFLKETLHEQNLVMQSRFAVNANGAILNLNFRIGSVNRDNESRKSVTIDCNIHQNGRFDSATLKTEISKWKNGKDMVYSALVAVLEVN